MIKTLTEVVRDTSFNIKQKPFIIYLCSEFNNIASSIGTYKGSRSYGIGWETTDYIFNNYSKILKET